MYVTVLRVCAYLLYDLGTRLLAELCSNVRHGATELCYAGVKKSNLCSLL